MFNTSSISGHITLESAGLVALADLSTVAVRTALTGTASWLDILVLAPGMHQQQSADEVNRGEFPQTGSLTSGHVFRIENPATVSYLQSIGRTGYLVTAQVEPKSTLRYSLMESIAALLYLLCPLLTIIVFALVGSIKDWWALGVLWMLALSRMINVVIIKQRVADSKDWKGGDEKPEAKGDLLVILSQDRWVRLRGQLYVVKRVTAGQWLRDENRVESLAVGIATLLVYAAAALAGNASTVGSLLIALLLLCSVASLALGNSFTYRLQMYNCIVQEDKTLEKTYERRSVMVEDLIVEEINNTRGQDDRESDPGEWAIQMGLIKRSELRAILQRHLSPSALSRSIGLQSSTISSSTDV
ncbi:uncharacterized protein EV420DRAFT_1646231 [Desarmillaria tabescens]|uniref:Uncharacterized protein n=1 Tax=Armillaria tabescens TaxID=1929756 RepID=A0AA39JYU2_ARMTA|nr:uncharacterized protein EV420DRAFT_1646231 [Desarmillaria tabescens]KAK0451152.1 hypothetical protein EV420DRAFT_1646231 [Desarmillaria tabescens]